MRRRAVGIVFTWIAAAMVAVVSSAHAETRVALVIGNSNYANVPVLANPANDADLVASALRRVGFTDVTELKSLDQAGLKAALQRFAGRARGADVALVYYAGHGMEMGGVNYLIPVDAKLESDTDLEFEAVPLDLALTAAGGARQLRLVIMDACRNNPFAVHMRSTGARRAVTRGLAPIEPQGNTLVFYSAKDGTTAEDGSGANSPFATAFSRDIATPGLEIGKLVRRVRDDVLASTSHEQEPFLYGSLSSEDFYFVPPAAGAPLAAPQPAPTVDREVALWQSVENSNDAAQLQSYLDQYPAGTFAGAARAKLKALKESTSVALIARPAPPLPAANARAVELEVWDSVKDSSDIGQLQSYLDQYPKGSFARVARAKIAALGKAASPGQAPLAASNPRVRPPLGHWGIDLNAMDPSIAPGDNFFLYANGNWLKSASIPPDRTSAGPFQDLRVLSETRVREILAGLQARAPNALSGSERKVRNLYEAFLDTGQLESRGLGAAKQDLNQLEQLKTSGEIARAMGSLKLAASGPFDLGIEADPRNPSAYAVNITAGGLGMPDREYYLSDDKRVAAIRESYRKYLGDMLSLAGFPNAIARAQNVLDLETKLAKALWTSADRRDPDKTYNAMSVSELKALAPQFDWDGFLAEAGIPTNAGVRRVIVAEKSALPGLAKLFADTPMDVWRDYLVVHYLHNFAAELPKRFDDLDFSFYGTVLLGNGQQSDRAARAVHLVDTEMGDALGQLYVAKFFGPEAKARAETLVGNVVKAFEADIRTLSWMSGPTRARALDKLHQFTAHLGYPDRWRDYGALQISRDDLLRDVQRGYEFEWNRKLSRLDGPVDKTEWGMTPSTINAYYDPRFNAVFFPAAILQPPFFDPKADDAVNYGGIGAVIGHEISHGFDDQGSRTLGDGRNEDWWTPADHDTFNARAKQLSDQFDGYEPFPGLHINGRNTQGENLGDLAGLSIALKAYHFSLGGNAAPVLDGFTGDQRFFLGFAQIWRTKYTDNALRAQLVSGPHSPPEFRVDGTTRNNDAWYAAFDVGPGGRYYLSPDQRVKLW